MLAPLQLPGGIELLIIAINFLFGIAILLAIIGGFYRDTRRVPRGLTPRVKLTRGFTFTAPGDD